MKKIMKHRVLNSVLLTALFVPFCFILLRDTIAAITGIMFESIGGKESFLYQINEDGKELTILLPYEVGGKYDLKNSDPESFVLKESRGKRRHLSLFVFPRRHQHGED